MYHFLMQVTLAIDDDVLAAAERLASQQQKSVDEVITDLSRKGLQPNVLLTRIPEGFPVLPVRDSTPVTLEFVNRLRDGID